jgi:hypothetical protein
MYGHYLKMHYIYILLINIYRFNFLECRFMKKSTNKIDFSILVKNTNSFCVV